MFAGGDRDAFDRAAPVLQVLARPHRLTYAGTSGNGQILKGVNQLAMGLVSAAWLETLSFASRQGIAFETIADAVGADNGWRKELTEYCRRLAAGEGEGIDLKFAELPYFLSAAAEAGLEMPLTEALHAFCDPAPRN